MIDQKELLTEVRKNNKFATLSQRTKELYLTRISQFLTYHNNKYCIELSEQDVVNFLTYLSRECKKSISTQNQALSAISFLYKDILNLPLACIHYLRAEKNSEPFILSRAEVEILLSQLNNVEYLIGSLMYGAGLRLKEALRLRFKDINFEDNKIYVSDAKGSNLRTTILPVVLKIALAEYLHNVTLLYQQDLKSLLINSPLSVNNHQKQTFAKTLEWQYIFPDTTLIKGSSTSNFFRHYMPEVIIRKAIKKAIRKTGLNSNINCSTLRHSFAVHSLENGFKLYTVKGMMGHQDIRTTMIYKKMLHEKYSREKLL